MGTGGGTTEFRSQLLPRYVTLWLSSEAIAAWTPRRSGHRGGQRRYSDLAIETALTLRLLYHLPLASRTGSS